MNEIFGKNINEELAEAVMTLYSKTFFSKALKVSADFNKVFNFEKFLIYVLPKI